MGQRGALVGRRASAFSHFEWGAGRGIAGLAPRVKQTYHGAPSLSAKPTTRGYALSRFPGPTVQIPPCQPLGGQRSPSKKHTVWMCLVKTPFCPLSATGSTRTTTGPAGAPRFDTPRPTCYLSKHSLTVNLPRARAQRQTLPALRPHAHSPGEVNPPPRRFPLSALPRSAKRQGLKSPLSAPFRPTPPKTPLTPLPHLSGPFRPLLAHSPRAPRPAPRQTYHDSQTYHKRYNLRNGVIPPVEPCTNAPV